MNNRDKQNILREKLKQALVSTARVISNDFRDKNSTDDNKNLKEFDILNLENINSKRLKEIGKEGVITMICDSTNVFSAGRAGSELDVRNNMLKVTERLNKRIIITSFASNVARMETAFYCAEKIGRQIATMEARIFDRDEKLVATLMHTAVNFAIPKHED